VFSAGMSIRFSTLLYIPLILLATQGIVWLSNKISKPVWKKVLIIILILYFISTPVINREFLFEEDIRHDAYKFLKEANINPDCTLISYTYVSVLAIVDSNVVSNEYLKEHGPRIDKIVENGGCVLFYMNSDVIKNMDFGDQDIFLKSLEIKYDVEEYLNFKGRDLFLYKLKGIKK